MRNILITGVSTGIGFETAQSFLAQGDTVIGSVRDLKTIQDPVRQLKNKYGSRLILWSCDLLKLENIDSITSVLEENNIQQIDGLINNAGIAIAAPVQYQKFSEIQDIITTNVLAVIKLTQIIIPYMISNQGRIINISSVSGQAGTPFLAAYCASKHAIEGFSESLRREMKFHGIAVCIVGPGSIKTPIWSKSFESIRSTYASTPFAKSFDRFLDFAVKEMENALPVSAVVENINHAMNSSSPKIRYAPIPRRLMGWLIPQLLPKRMYDRIACEVLGLNIKKK